MFKYLMLWRQNIFLLDHVRYCCIASLLRSLSLSWASYLNLTLHSIFPNVTEICKLKCWALCWIIGYWNLNSNILPSTYLATTTNTPAHNKYIVHSSGERVEWESVVLESVKISCWQFWHWCTSFGEGPYWRLLLVLVGTLNKEKGNRCLNGQTLIEM